MPLIRPLTAADAEGCDAVVASLPYHFGDEGGIAECARAVRAGPGLVAEVDGAVAGFLTVDRHLATSGEITWMAVRADARGRGIGAALIDALAAELRAEGRSLLLVLTLAASVPEPGVADGYARTRAFYRGRGFVDAREFIELWPNYAALLMVKSLESWEPSPTGEGR